MSDTTRSQPDGTRSSYHHGDLAHALVDSARNILETEGLAKLSLRAAAREAGVSQAAPYHHFKDKQALLASVAAQGHREFTAAMRDGMEKAGTDARQRLLAAGVAYVEFATTNPALFRLMFGSTIEHSDRYPELVQAGETSFQTLETAMAQMPGADTLPAETLRMRSLKAWCSVHGLATLLIDGGLDASTFGMTSATELAEQLLQTVEA